MKVIRFTLLSLLLLSEAAITQQIDWFSIDGGGGISNAGDIQLIGVIGQADTARMVGADISLSGGYLPLPVKSNQLFKDSFE